MTKSLEAKRISPDLILVASFGRVDMTFVHWEKKSKVLNASFALFMIEYSMSASMICDENVRMAYVENLH